eukprot:GSChrysophyteH1.ASY1.ANO1.363.1 assembled CDS
MSLDEEIECIQAIFPDELTVSDLPPVLSRLKKRIALKLPHDISAVIVIPQSYPDVSPVLMKATYSWMVTQTEAFMTKNFNPGHVFLLPLIQFMRDMVEQSDDTADSPPHNGATAEKVAATYTCTTADAVNFARLTSRQSDLDASLQESHAMPAEDFTTEETALLAGASGDAAYGSLAAAVGGNAGAAAAAAAADAGIFGFSTYSAPFANIGSGMGAGLEMHSFETSRSDRDLNIAHSEPVVDRKSVFVGHACAVNNMEDVEQFKEQLLSDKKIAKATHNILAYRFTSDETGVCHHDSDDDGENAAGARIAEMLRLIGVGASGELGAAVIVTRWYGGVHLGPDRFKHICKAAREALEIAGLATKGVSNTKANTKARSKMI